MTVAVWRIAEVNLGYSADDLSGVGAKRSGGRWNSKGWPVVYASENIALAVLETIVHIRPARLPQNRYLVRINIPDDVWHSRSKLNTPPIGWDAQPFGMPGIIASDVWLRGRSTAVMVVPSVIVPEERTVLLNPEHPDTERVTATMLRKWNYDCRCF